MNDLKVILNKKLNKYKSLFSNDETIAKELYSALCNIKWVHKESGKELTVSWRGAGGFVASLREKNEDYLDFYCAGGEGLITQRIRKIMNKAGFKPKPYPGDKLTVVDKINYPEPPTDEEFEAGLEWLKEMVAKKQ